MSKKDIHPVLHNTIKEITPTLKKLALRIHANPEMGFQEKQACSWQTAILKRWNFKVVMPFANISTAYNACAGSGAPVFCFMSEYDALPGIGHACGHNLIAAAALGAGRALAVTLKREKIPGTIVVMGTPAEETLGGKVKMVEGGALKGLDAVMMAHPAVHTAPDSGSAAVHRYAVDFHGKAAHAAGSPELGLNALDAVMLLFQGVNAWRQRLLETSRVHGIIDNGGEAPNIIPDFSSCYFYLRALDVKTLQKMRKTFVNIVRGAALMTGTGFELKIPSPPYRERRPNSFLNEAFVEYAEKLGLNPVASKKVGRASSDFGDVSQIIPGSHVYFGISRKKIAGHSIEKRDAAKSAYGMQQMIRAAETLAHVGYRFFTDTDFRQNVISDFQSR